MKAFHIGGFQKRITILLLCVMSVYGCSLWNRVKSAGSGLDIDKVHFVDKIGNNWLFRGDSPLAGDFPNMVFSYKELITYLRQAAQSSGYGDIFPEAFLLYDISLMNVTEFIEIKVERAFFEKNPHLGTFINFPVLGWGNIISKESFLAQHPDIKKIISKENQGFDNGLERLRTALEKQHDISVIFFVHCAAGCDRTGQTIAAYRMKYYFENYREVMRKNTLECTRPPNEYSVNATKHYCAFLEEKGGQYSDLCD